MITEMSDITEMPPDIPSLCELPSKGFEKIKDDATIEKSEFLLWGF